MNQLIKNYIKKNIPSRYIELITNKGIILTKIPNGSAVISDFFVLRVEQEWETYFECLQFQSLLNAEVNEQTNIVHFVFYNQNGDYVGEKEVKIETTLKTTLDVNKIAAELGIKKDGLFAVFHTHKENWLNKFKSYLAERGYVGYANKKQGPIKAFVHGNLDAIAKYHDKSEYQLLGNYSYLEKEFFLQHDLNPNNTYELYLVNPTNKTQEFLILEKNKKNPNTISFSLPPRGSYKYVRTVDKKEKKVNIIIKSKLYLARPVVFKIMPKAFDVFHG